MLEKTLESPLNRKEIKPVNPKGKLTLNVHWKDWCWSWSSNALATRCKELTHWKRPYYWESWRQEEKGLTEDEMVGCHHRLNGHELEQAPGVSDGQGGLACCSPWGLKESDTAENWTGLTKLENETATQSSILTWKVLCAKESGRLRPKGFRELDMTEQLYHHHHQIVVQSFA